MCNYTIGQDLLVNNSCPILFYSIILSILSAVDNFFVAKWQKKIATVIVC